AARPAPVAAPAPRAANPTPAPYAAAAMAATAASPGRPPMIAAVPTKRSALVERTLAKMAARLAEATGLEAGSPELLALLKLSTEVVERIVWEIVPELAESIIRENLHELAAKRN
ncbi:MAG: response regulator, partial [Deltaproteobacteria bacterium]|nr:response regulator [Deltaproteobacteria bacterium]